MTILLSDVRKDKNTKNESKVSMSGPDRGKYVAASYYVQSSDKERALGCVYSPPRPEAPGRGITQPRAFFRGAL